MAIIHVSAPGKMMLSGEYAVLDGAPAIVAAVGARAHFRLGEAGDLSARPEATSSLVEAVKVFGGADAVSASFDTSAQASGDRKLGLGSSAAVAAGAAAAVAVREGRSLDDAETRGALFRAAFDGHRVVAPEGSGADVAAACLGGVIEFRPGADGALPATRSLPWPEGLVASVIWTGQPARTSNLVRQVRALGERDPEALAERMRALAEASVDFVGAFDSGSASAVVTQARRYHALMSALGEAAGAPIVEARLAKVAALAEAVGGGAKPSGAGGGDVAIGFFVSEEDRDAFEEAARAAGFDVLELELGAEGPRVEP